jgi:DNA-binding SARP family transcriptional activator
MTGARPADHHQRCTRPAASHRRGASGESTRKTVWPACDDQYESITSLSVSAQTHSKPDGSDPGSCYANPAGNDEEGVNTSRSGGGCVIDTEHTPAVFIRTLGVFQVIRDGAPIPHAMWRSKKARDLLKILIARRKATSREQLVELLWPEVSPAKGGNRLSVLLWTLRNVLQPHASAGPLATNGAVVWLDRHQVNVDVEKFLTDALAALAAHRAGHPNATERLITAHTAYTGDFLEDDAHQDWAISLAEEVRATHLSLLRALAARLEHAGDTDEATRYLLRLIEQDPFDEQAHLDLINIQLDAGHLGEAHRHYHIYAQRMKQLDVHPQPLPQNRRSTATSP